MANHSSEWHAKNQELAQAMRDARDAWSGSDHDRAKDLDREVATLKDELKELD